MQGNIREQMNRYPVFSCNTDAYIDESDLFRDEEMKMANRNYTLKSRNDYKNQTIVSIYDRILSNNANDPLYVHARREKEKNFSTVTTARNSRSNLETSTKKNDKTKAITKFMGELASSIRKDDTSTIDGHRTQKISLLKRIIEHYNVKSVERKYYSNLIKNFGLRIQSVNSSEIAVKKNIHPRVSTSKNLHIEINDEPADMNTQQNVFESKIPYRTIKKQPLTKKVGPVSSLMVKQYSLQYSREDLKPKKSNTLLRQDIKLRGHISQKMRRSIEYSQKIFQKPLKIQSSTCIQDKINKYRDFLFLINFSNHMYRNLDVEKYQKPFKFYVGKGNNGNLIKSLMKKRFWFEQVNDSNEADFVWTQIKIEEMFSKQQSVIKKEEFQPLQIIKTDDQIQQEQKKYEEIKNEIKLNEKMFTNNKNIKFGKYKTKAKDYAPQDPILKVVSNEEAKKFKEMNQTLAYKKSPTFADKFRSTTRKLKNQSSLTPFTTVHNHFPNNGLLGNKKALFYNIKQYCKLKGKALSDFIPRTYHIRKGLTDEEYKQVSLVYMEKKKIKVPNYWIMKPGQFSNRGQGITCTNKLDDIRKRIGKCRDESKNGRQSTLIVQEYITNPLLYNGRKFDIRVYMMVTINNGKIKGYWYQEGYVRTSSFPWSLNQMEDKFIHLTNDAIQKGCEEYGRYQPGNKLTFTDLQRYLHTLPKCGRNLQFFDQIYPQMRRIATDVIKSVYVNLDPKRCRDNFEIFGLDFMIDENIKTWLIEVNTNPCLELNCPILQRIIPHMVENAFRICLDPLFPPPSCLNSEYKYSIPENALHYNKFELVFDEDEEGESLRKLYQNSDVMQQMDDFQEDQELYENEGNLLEISQD